MITHDTPESSNIARLSYDEENSTLTVEFRNGKRYSYLDVHYETWNEFISAPSAGKFFNQHIQGKYKS